MATRHHIQGEHAVSGHPDAVYSTILGSCIACCLNDPTARVGGMNHFLLPDGDHEDGQSMRYGAYAMELLINDMLKAGARRDQMQAKIFGGAKMFQGLNDVGASNAAFAQRFLLAEGIPVIGSSLGGLSARRVQFWPAEGRARQRFVTQDVPVEVRRAPAPAPVDDGGEVELF